MTDRQHSLAKGISILGIAGLICKIVGVLYKIPLAQTIGPMGMGGKTTLLAVKLAALSRLPASYFVTIAYMCWACRRQTVRVTVGGDKKNS